MTTQTLHLIDEYLTQGGYTPGIDAETLEREAHLVAAAPDLLAVTERFVAACNAYLPDATHQAFCGLFASAAEAITKAKGN